MKFRVAIISVLVFAVIVYQTDGLCNTCAAITNIACVDVNKFRLCSDGVPSGAVVVCPGTTICTPDARVCAENTTDVQNTCARCEECDDKKIFACRSYNTFSLCGGNDTYGDDEYICPEGLVCNVDTETICVDPNSGIGGTCAFAEPVTTTTTEVIITTTPNALSNPNGFCANRGAAGRFEVSGDPNCRQFIQCISSSGTWIGNVYMCSRGNYFNVNTQQCDTQIPARCAPPSPPSPPSTS